MKIIELIHLIENFEDVEFSGPISQDKIDLASRELSINFPLQYREFLSYLGSGSISSESFIGLGGPRHLDVVWLTKTMRAKKGTRSFGEHLLPVRSDGYGNYDCIDTSQPTSESEFAIVEWLHDGSDFQGNRILATSYFNWFYSMLKMLKGIEQQ